MVLFTIIELAERLNIRPCTIRKMIKDGLPYIRMGRTYRFDLDAVDKWLKAKEATNANK